MKSILLLSLAFILISCAETPLSNTHTPSPKNTQQYTISIEVTWDSLSHPYSNFPIGPESWNQPHFSSIIGLSHGTEFSLWHSGNQASLELKACAENGDADPYKTLINTTLDADKGLQLMQTSGGPAPSKVSTTVTVSEQFPLLSFVSMIAPSPDWFFGVESLDLRQSGAWRDTIVVELFPYDAGTKDGTSYSYAFEATSPAQSISPLRGTLPFSDKPVAKLTLIREQ